jgi:SAM-dependent methyltransferase
MQLPFADGEFDAVVCQFGVMFFPDKPRAHAEVHRALSAGGRYIFSVWDRLQENELAEIATSALAEVFPNDPPRFLARTPYGYHDVATIKRDLAAGGFTAPPEIVSLLAHSQAKSNEDGAVAFCQGTPLRAEIEAGGPSRLGEATSVVAEAIAQKFGSGPIDAKMQAHIVTVTK